MNFEQSCLRSRREVDGRWYGRGAADCKGNIVAHLMALRALDQDHAVAASFSVSALAALALGRSP